jgi:Nuclear transport factor 2 (NTF2) domain
MMTFEGQQFQGTDNIMNKLRTIGNVKHLPKSTDIQPSTEATNAIIIFVTGTISIANDNPLHYCEMFQLVSTSPGQFYVHNCVFRLNYGL